LSANKFITSYFLNKPIQELVNNEINNFNNLKNEIRDCIPKQNQLRELLIPEDVEEEDPSNIEYVYRIIISKRESTNIFSNNYSRMRTIVNDERGIMGIFQEEENDNEIILGFAKYNNDSCEYLLLRICQLIGRVYDYKENFNRKNYRKPSLKLKRPPHSIGSKTEQCYERKKCDKKCYMKDSDRAFQIKFLVQKEKIELFKEFNNDLYNVLANHFAIRIKIFDTIFPNSNEQLLMVEGTYDKLKIFLFFARSHFRRNEEVKLQYYIPTLKYFLDFEEIQKQFLKKDDE